MKGNGNGLSHHFIGVTEKNHENPQDIFSQGLQNLKQATFWK
jgi:hypothetical protein